MRLERATVRPRNFDGLVLRGRRGPLETDSSIRSAREDLPAQIGRRPEGTRYKDQAEEKDGQENERGDRADVRRRGMDRDHEQPQHQAECCQELPA
jgi:hypothetical protein